MNLSDWGAVADIVASIGVIITLVYLAIQIHQNTRQIKSQGLQAAIAHFLRNFDETTKTGVDADIFRKGLNDFENLTAGDQGCFHSKMHSLLHGFNNVWNLYKAGLLPEYELIAMRGLFLSMLTSPGGQKWWQVFKHVPPPQLVDYIDQSVREADGKVLSAIDQFPWLRSDESTKLS